MRNQNDLIYKEPIQVICVNTRNSTKLIKGATYLATAIHTYAYNGQPTRRIYLKDVGGYSLPYFTLLDGRSLDNEPDFTVERDTRIDTKKDYTGQFVKCTYSSGKSFKKDELYYVENQVSTNKNRYNGVKFKIRGIKNLVNCYRFSEVSIAEQRKIKLNNIKGNKTKTGEQTRKFLLYTENEKVAILFETLTRVLIDVNKIQVPVKIDIVGLMLLKGKNYALLEEDIKPFLKGKIETILKPFNK